MQKYIILVTAHSSIPPKIYLVINQKKLIHGISKFNAHVRCPKILRKNKHLETFILKYPQND